MTRIFFVAGESSGDLHGANLIRALKQAEPALICEGLGGRRMGEAGMTVLFDLAEMAIMGFSEVVRAFKRLRLVFLDSVKYLERKRPDAVVLIDYPGFNIRLAKRAHALGIPVVYYISPQVWAWKKGRIHTLARIVRKMLVIFPFEQALYERVGLDCLYVGHPLLDHIAAYRPPRRKKSGFVVGLLPGSREQEITRLLEPMLDVARGIQARYPEARFAVPCVDAARERQVRALAGDFPLETAVGDTFCVLSRARFCMVASGTATLETALFRVPMVIMYKTGAVNYWIGRCVVNLTHIGIVNILARRGIVPEFIQHEATPGKILPLALDLIADSPARAAMLEAFDEVRALLGAGGASQRAAQAVLDVLEEGRHG